MKVSQSVHSSATLKCHQSSPRKKSECHCQRCVAFEYWKRLTAQRWKGDGISAHPKCSLCQVQFAIDRPTIMTGMPAGVAHRFGPISNRYSTKRTSISERRSTKDALRKCGRRYKAGASGS